MTTRYDYIAHHYGVCFEPGQRVIEPLFLRGGIVLPPRAAHQHYIQVQLDGYEDASLHHPLELEILPPSPEIEADGHYTLHPKLPQCCSPKPKEATDA